MPDEIEYPALYHVLREANISRESSLAICGAVDSCGLQWISSATLGSALLQWRREGVNRRLGRVRVICKDLLDHLKDTEGQAYDCKNVHAEQLTIVDFLEQVSQLAGAEVRRGD